MSVFVNLIIGEGGYFINTVYCVILQRFALIFYKMEKSSIPQGLYTTGGRRHLSLFYVHMSSTQLFPSKDRFSLLHSFHFIKQFLPYRAYCKMPFIEQNPRSSRILSNLVLFLPTYFIQTSFAGYRIKLQNCAFVNICKSFTDNSTCMPIFPALTTTASSCSAL